MCRSRESVRMRSHIHCLMLFIFSGFLLLRGGEADTKKEIVYTGKEYPSLAPLRRPVNHINSESVADSSLNKRSSSATEAIPNISLKVKNNSITARLSRSSLGGWRLKNHVGQTMRRNRPKKRT